ncbi:hypothetical protein Bca101_021709 [Brassica carinata]
MTKCNLGSPDIFHSVFLYMTYSVLTNAQCVNSFEIPLDYRCIDFDETVSSLPLLACTLKAEIGSVLDLSVIPGRNWEWLDPFDVDDVQGKCLLPCHLFRGKTLVKLSLGTNLYIRKLPPDVYLPALKSLFIDDIVFEDQDLCDVLLPGCPMLEELTVRHVETPYPYRISSQTIKKLTVYYLCKYGIEYSSFDAPSVVSLDYTDCALSVYPLVNLGPLLEAKMDLFYRGKIETPELTGLMIGISNVQTLLLSMGSVIAISRCVEHGLVLPVFKNLVKLSYGIHNRRRWKLLPYLLKQSPKVETLIIEAYNGEICEVTIGLLQVKVLDVVGYKGSPKEFEHLKCLLGGIECMERVRVEFSESLQHPSESDVVNERRWISSVVARGVLEVDVSLRPHWAGNVDTDEVHGNCFLPYHLFRSKTLVKLCLGTDTSVGKLPPDVSLPALKSLFIDNIVFEDQDLCDVLLPGCPVLEEFTVVHQTDYYPHRLSSRSLKKLTVFYDFVYELDDGSIMSFDTPSLVSLVYTDYALSAYPLVNLGSSLLEAKLDLSYCKEKIKRPDLSGLFVGISNVETLHLSPDSADVSDCSGLDCYTGDVTIGLFQVKVLGVLGYKGTAKELQHLKSFLAGTECIPKLRVEFPEDVVDILEAYVQNLDLSLDTVDVICRYVEEGLDLPVFKNLVKLSFGSYKERGWMFAEIKKRGWKLLLYLLKQSPKLETLITQGLDGYTDDVTIGLFQVKVLHVLGYRGSAKEFEHLKSLLGGTECMERSVRVEFLKMLWSIKPQ